MVQLTNEELVTVIRSSQNRDTVEKAKNEICSRYANSIEKISLKYAKKQPIFGLDEWRSYLWEIFWDVVRKYDPNNRHGASFQTFWELKAPKRVFDVIRANAYRRVDRQDVLRSEYMQVGTDLEERIYESGIVDERSGIEVRQDIRHTDLFKYIEQLSVDDARFLLLKEQGYTLTELADAFGRDGNVAAKKQWGKRVLMRLRKYASDYFEQSGAMDELTSFMTS